jgi:hypothetical protein
MLKQVTQSLISPTTIGCVLCIAIGLADIWGFHQLGELAKTLLYVGLGGLLGYSIPQVQVGIQVARKQTSTVPTQSGSTS